MWRDALNVLALKYGIGAIHHDVVWGGVDDVLVPSTLYDSGWYDVSAYRPIYHLTDGWDRPPLTCRSVVSLKIKLTCHVEVFHMKFAVN